MHNPRRLKLHEELKRILGNSNVYFQPPESIKLKYPCIIYSYQRPDIKKANNHLYRLVRNYQLTYVTKEPGSEMADRILNEFEMISMSRVFTSDNMNHYIYSLYY